LKNNDAVTPHQAFQGLAAGPQIHSDKRVSGYSGKPAAFVRSSRRFFEPEINCLRVRFA